jgi:aquaporin Z
MALGHSSGTKTSAEKALSSGSANALLWRMESTPGPAQRYLAEFIGTFVLVLGGVGCAVIAGSRVGALGIALAFGLSLLAMAYTIGPICGCHVNPAVSLGLMLAGKLERRFLIGYWIAQLAGAVLGAAVVLLIARATAGGYSAAVSGLGANGFGAHSPGGYEVGAAFLAEVVLTFLLVLTVLGSTDARAPAGFGGLAIGLVLTLIHLVGIPITNTSVNPARSFGSAVFVGGWALAQLWLFIVAPLLGGATAAAVYRVLRASTAARKETQRAQPPAAPVAGRPV